MIDPDMCRYGHDKRIEGRHKDNKCLACHRISSRDYGATYKNPDFVQSQARLPFAKLEAAVEASGLRPWQGYNGRSIAKWRADGIRPITADDICFKLLGKHPVDVFGADIWFHDLGRTA